MQKGRSHSLYIQAVPYRCLPSLRMLEHPRDTHFPAHWVGKGHSRIVSFTPTLAVSGVEVQHGQGAPCTLPSQRRAMPHHAPPTPACPRRSKKKKKPLDLLPPPPSQEILPPPLPPRRHRPPMIRHGAENLEVRLQILAHGHDTRHIPAAVAVVRRRPHRHHVLRREVVLVALVDELMGAGDEGQVVDVVELDDVSKG